MTEPVGLVLPSDLEWAKSYIQAIYAANENDSADLLNSFLSKRVEIVLNGVKISREDYINQMKGNNILRVNAEVTFADSVVGPKKHETAHFNPLISTSRTPLGLFIEVHFFQEVMVLGAPRSLHQKLSMNLVVSHDIDVLVPQAPFHYFDSRRVVQLNQVDGEAIADMPHLPGNLTK